MFRWERDDDDCGVLSNECLSHLQTFLSQTRFGSLASTFSALAQLQPLCWTDGRGINSINWVVVVKVRALRLWIQLRYVSAKIAVFPAIKPLPIKQDVANRQQGGSMVSSDTLLSTTVVTCCHSAWHAAMSMIEPLCLISLKTWWVSSSEIEVIFQKNSPSC